MPMVIEFDPRKSKQNEIDRGLPFELVNGLDWSTALVFEDARKDYGELRLLVLGYIGERLCSAVVTPRDTDLRVISLRRASRKEERIYEQETGRGGSRTP